MKHSIIDALRVKPFAYLMSAELFTQLGANIFSFYLIFAVFSLTRSNTAVAAIVLSFTIPAILFGIPAGVYVDRWDKKRVLFLSNFLRAILLIILALMYQNVYAIFFISFCISILTQFFIPAESPLIPTVVSPKLLLSANALFGLGIYGSMLIAFILSGPIILAFGRMQTLLFLAVLFFISCFFLWLIKIPPSKGERRLKQPRRITRAMMDELRDVIKLLSGTKEVHHSLFLLALSQVLILLIASLAPGYATSVLKVSVEQFPFLFIAPAACGVFVGAIIVSFLGKVKKDKIITIGLFLSGLAMVVLPYGSKIASKEIIIALNLYLPHIMEVTTFHLVTLIAFLLGFSNAFVFVPSNTILLENTSDQIRGKVYGVLNTIVGVFSLIPLVAAGWLSDLFGVTTVIIGIGVCLFLLGVLRFLFRV